MQPHDCLKFEVADKTECTEVHHVEEGKVLHPDVGEVGTGKRECTRGWLTHSCSGPEVHACFYVVLNCVSVEAANRLVSKYACQVLVKST